MATYKEATIQQSTGEIRKWTADFTDDLPGGITVSAGTATHIPPSGSAAAATISTTTTTVTAQIGPLTVTGIHYIDIQATYTNGEKSEVRITFTVNYPATAARSTMLDLIEQVREMANAGPNDYTVGGVPYWSDAQIQAALDRCRVEVVEEPLTYLDENEGGTINITRYYSVNGNFEQTDGGTALFVLRDASYTQVGTANWTADYSRGEVVFGTNTAGSAYYLTGRSYDLNAAAAQVWERKAAQMVNSGFVWSTDNMRVDKTGMRKEALGMARYYKSLAGPRSITLDRSDT